jgi:hypothetical protein
LSYGQHSYDDFHYSHMASDGVTVGGCIGYCVVGIRDMEWYQEVYSMKPGDVVRVLVDVDNVGDAMDANVPYTVVDVLRDVVYVQRLDGVWFANEFEWCVNVGCVVPWKYARLEAAV